MRGGGDVRARSFSLFFLVFDEAAVWGRGGGVWGLWLGPPPAGSGHQDWVGRIHFTLSASCLRGVCFLRERDLVRFPANDVDFVLGFYLFRGPHRESFAESLVSSLPPAFTQSSHCACCTGNSSSHPLPLCVRLDLFSKTSSSRGKQPFVMSQMAFDASQTTFTALPTSSQTFKFIQCPITNFTV